MVVVAFHLLLTHPLLGPQPTRSTESYYIDQHGSGTILKMSEQAQLITKPALNNEYIRDPDSDHSCPSFLLALPYELLANILELAIIPNNIHKLSWRIRELGHDPAATLAIAYTCRLFSQIVVPFNYRSINFCKGASKGLFPIGPRLRLLARTFQCNPSLGLHCREFKMNIPAYQYSSQEDFDFVEQQILPFLPNVKSLLVHGGFDTEEKQQTWKLVQVCIQHMRRLDILELDREAGGLVVADVIREVQIPWLKELRVGGVARSDSVCYLGDFKVRSSLCSVVSLAFVVFFRHRRIIFPPPADPEPLRLPV